MEIKVFLDDGAKMPTKAHKEDAGFDLYTSIDFVVDAHSSVVVSTGVHMMIPDGYVGMIKSKSGLNVKDGILGEGVVDANYTGSIVAKLYNNSDKEKVFHDGDKIIQIVIIPIPDVSLAEVDSVDELGTSERGSNGFGSSGR